MTFQPPPADPPASTPPPPPPPARGPGAFDPKAVNPLDWALAGIGVILLLFSFFQYYTIDVGFASESDGAWHFGSGSFIGWLAFIAGLAAAVIAVLPIFVPNARLSVPNYVAAMGLFAISAVLYIIGFFVIGPDDSGCRGVAACENAVDDAFSFGFSYWLSFILVIVGAVIALMRAQQTGAQLPGALANVPNIGAKGPGARPGPASGTTPPPPPGYGPPQ